MIQIKKGFIKKSGIRDGIWNIFKETKPLKEANVCNLYGQFIKEEIKNFSNYLCFRSLTVKFSLLKSLNLFSLERKSGSVHTYHYKTITAIETK